MVDMHIPVLAKEISALLNLKEGDKAIDATFGFGGHTKLMLEAVGESGSVLALEQDKEIIGMSAMKNKNLKLVSGNFRDIGTVAKEHGFLGTNAILMDLGISRWHFLGSGRGFSFQDPKEPLIMNLDAKNETTAAKLLNGESAEELAKIFISFGEVKYPLAHRVAGSIVDSRKKRKIISVGDLLEIINRVVPKRGKTNPATQFFQALRIAVNNELENLKQALEAGIGILAPGGRLLVISFHSLEDRIVKNMFKEKYKNGEINILTKKPITASRDEVLENPPSRSAKLRIIEKI